MSGLLGDTWDDPRTIATMQAAQGLLNGRGSSMQRLSGGLLDYGQSLRAAQAIDEERKRREAEARQMMAMRAMQMEQAKRQQAEAAQAQAKAAAIEQAFRGAIKSPDQQAMQQFGGPTRAAAAAAPSMQPQIDQQALLQGLMKADPMAAFQMLQPKPDDQVTVAPGGTVWSKRDNKAVFTAPERPEKINPNQPFMMIDGKIVPNPAYQQYEMMKARAGKSDISVSYGAPVAGLQDGKPVFFQPDKGGGSPAIVPGVQPANVVEQLEKAAEAKRRTASNASMAYATIDKMLKHPGLDTAVGMTSVTDPRNFIPGTSAQGAKALIEQAQGQAFMQAFETLKGGGQITEKEGEKATMAIARLKTAQNEADFKAAANELRTIARDAYKRSTGQDIGAQQQSLDDLLRKYGGN